MKLRLECGPPPEFGEKALRQPHQKLNVAKQVILYSDIHVYVHAYLAILLGCASLLQGM